MLEAKLNEIGRSAWKQEAVILALWALWLVLVSCLELPHLIYLPGTAFLLIYATWALGFLQAAVFLLFAAWIYASFSLTLSGIFWLSAFIIFLLLKIAQFRFMIRTPFQFFIALWATAFAMSFLQYWMLSEIYEGNSLNLNFLVILFSSAFCQALIGALLFKPLRILVGLR